MSYLRQHRKLFRLVVISLFIVPSSIAVALFVRWANAPAEQTITTATTTIKQDQLLPVQTVQTAYYSFTVPTNFRVRSATDPNNINLIHTQVIEQSDMSRQIGVTTNLLTSDGLKGVADYNLRASTPQTYERYTKDDIPAGAIAFRNPTTSELTMFMTHNNRYASISVSGLGGNGRLRGLFSQIYTSWQWN